MQDGLLPKCLLELSPWPIHNSKEKCKWFPRRALCLGKYHSAITQKRNASGNGRYGRGYGEPCKGYIGRNKGICAQNAQKTSSSLHVYAYVILLPWVFI